MVEKVPTKTEEFTQNKTFFEDLMKQRFFYTQSFQIYGGITGLYDYGHPGCAIRNNLEQQWREHFVVEDELLELSLPHLTPYNVFKTSGHVERFSDFMVKDVETNTAYRADKLVESVLEERLQREDSNLNTEQKKPIIQAIQEVGNLEAEKIDECIKYFNIRSPTTGNKLSKAYSFNLMYQTSIGSADKGLLRPEAAQGIFVNFQRLLEYNGGRMPFGAASVGTSFKNDLHPKSLLRALESKLAEVEYFIEPHSKNHSKFSVFKNIKIPLLPSSIQWDSSIEPRTDLTIGEAVAQGIVGSEIMGYFLVRAYLFWIHSGLKEACIRFRQLRGDEFSFFPPECWNSEVLISSGWIKVAEHKDRFCYALASHSKATNQALVAVKNVPEPTSEGTIETEEEEEHKFTQLEYTPQVLEQIFDLERLFYCVLEHSFRRRGETKVYLRFPLKLTPYKVTIIPLIDRLEYHGCVQSICNTLV